MFTQEQKDFLAKQKQAAAAKQNPGFDLRNKVIDPKTGDEIEQDYFIHLQGQNKVFERPPESGNLFYQSGEQAGRFEMKDGKKTINPDAPHIAVKAPVDAQAEMTEQLKAETESLRKELAAVKAEKEAAEKAQAAMTQKHAANVENKATQQQAGQR